VSAVENRHNDHLSCFRRRGPNSMGGVVVLPLRVSRNLSTSVERDREAAFGQSS
jgi:hypothetical protein